MKRRWAGPWDQITMVVDGQDTVVRHGDVIDDELVTGTLNEEWWPEATDGDVSPAETDTPAQTGRKKG